MRREISPRSGFIKDGTPLPVRLQLESDFGTPGSKVLMDLDVGREGGRFSLLQAVRMRALSASTASACSFPACSD